VRGILTDGRAAIRTFRKNPGFSAVVAATPALGVIVGTTATLDPAPAGTPA
jgi:hypothetical protein